MRYLLLISQVAQHTGHARPILYFEFSSGNSHVQTSEQRSWKDYDCADDLLTEGNKRQRPGFVPACVFNHKFDHVAGNNHWAHLLPVRSEEWGCFLCAVEHIIYDIYDMY
jgi:hypothetical protein